MHTIGCYIDKILFKFPITKGIWLKRRIGRIGIHSKIKNPELITEPDRIYVGDRTIILPHSRIQSFGYRSGIDNKIVIGNGCYCGFHLSILAGADIIIHDNVLIASYVLISSENHEIDPRSSIPYMEQELRCFPVEIGEGTWIGEKVSIMPGVTVGKKCVIGANAVVTHSIPDYSMAVGSPARIIKRYDFDKGEWIKA